MKKKHPKRGRPEKAAEIKVFQLTVCVPGRLREKCDRMKLAAGGTSAAIVPLIEKHEEVGR